MTKLKRFTVAASIVLIFSPAASAEIRAADKPIEKIELTTSFLGGWRFKHGQDEIRHLSKLEEIILSSGDEAAAEHFYRSQKLLYAGIAVSLPMVLYYTYKRHLATDPIFEMGIIPGAIVDTAVFMMITYPWKYARERQLKMAIDRYNNVVEKKWGVSFQYSPESKKLGLVLRCSF